MLKDFEQSLADLVTIFAALIGDYLLTLCIARALWFDFHGAGFWLLATGLCAAIYFACRAHLSAGHEEMVLRYLQLLVAGLAVIFLLWSGQEFGKGNLLVGLHHAAEAVLLAPFWWLLRQVRFGWVLDANGERQKVLGLDRFGVIFDPTTHELRRRQAFESRQKRLLYMALSGALSLMLGFAAFVADREQTGLYVVPAALAALPALAFLCLLGIELVYQAGFPHMPGAKVTDPSPDQAGLALVQGQKAHGDAREATEQEALDLLKN